MEILLIMELIKKIVSHKNIKPQFNKIKQGWQAIGELVILIMIILLME